jgi:site-specific recombinase XerD
MENSKQKIEPFIPIYARAPNKLIRYKERPFVCQAGNHGIERVAIFTDRSGKQQEMTAQVIWKDL